MKLAKKKKKENVTFQLYSIFFSQKKTPDNKKIITFLMKLLLEVLKREGRKI